MYNEMEGSSCGRAVIVAAPVGFVLFCVLDRKMHIREKLGNTVEKRNDNVIHEGDLTLRHSRLSAVHKWAAWQAKISFTIALHVEFI
mmetsp:Transcript_67782/g.78756  ORF Transcript_67782/g.78756 Transcript_67782/m.78756 type:complete len:87 (-) Transcript_67782:222-482(-)